jgi:adenosylmethionine-8-amino-7-oxononanoate aminotransferase
VHRQGGGYFGRWRRVPHPAVAGTDAALSALRELVTEIGADDVVCVYVEPVQERTGRVLPEAYLDGLDALKRELDLPIAFVETATACYRSGKGAFASSALRTTPDVLLWWGGGQAGFVHVNDRYFVPTALTLVSTWDGDELSLVRVHHQLRAARSVDVAALGDAWGRALEPASAAGFDVRGMGLYRVVDAGARALEIADGLLSKGFRVRRFPNGCLGVVPPLDLGTDAAVSFGNALREVCR